MTTDTGEKGPEERGGTECPRSRPETDVGPSVPEPAVRLTESPFLVEVQEYRPRRIAVERLFRGLPTGYIRESRKSQPVPLLGRHGPFLTVRHPLCCGADVLEGFSVPAGVNYPERSEEHVRPCTVESPGPSGSSPVERAVREEPGECSVHPGLAPVAGVAEPVQVLQCERPPERLGSHRPCDIDGQPVVELRGMTVTALAHRDLDAEWLLS